MLQIISLSLYESGSAWAPAGLLIMDTIEPLHLLFISWQNYDSTISSPRHVNVCIKGGKPSLTDGPLEFYISLKISKGTLSQSWQSTLFHCYSQTPCSHFWRQSKWSHRWNFYESEVSVCWNNYKNSEFIFLLFSRNCFERQHDYFRLTCLAGCPNAWLDELQESYQV